MEWSNRPLFRKIPVPHYAKPDLNKDRLMSLFHSGSDCVFDFWQIRRVENDWIAGSGNSISLGGNGIYANSGGRAGGSSFLAGLVWPEVVPARD